MSHYVNMTFIVVLFWLLFIIWAISLLTPIAAPFNKACSLIPCILIGILGYLVTGNPFHK